LEAAQPATGCIVKPRALTQRPSPDAYRGPETRAIVDINGDWFPDYVQARQMAPQCYSGNGGTYVPDYRYYLNTRSGLANDYGARVGTSSAQFPNLAFVACGGGFSGGSAANVGGLWADVNGDGLEDVMQNNQTVTDYLGGYSTSVNRSGTFAASGTWAPPLPALYANNEQHVPYLINDTSLVDLNNDGLPDFYGISSPPTYVAQINTGSGFSATSSWNYTVAYGPMYYMYHQPKSPFDNGVRILDINGDDLPDIARSYYTASNYGTLGSYSNLLPPPYAGTNTVKEVYINTGNGFVSRRLLS
jgi:hypothetical protein